MKHERQARMRNYRLPLAHQHINITVSEITLALFYKTIYIFGNVYRLVLDDIPKLHKL